MVSDLSRIGSYCTVKTCGLQENCRLNLFTVFFSLVIVKPVGVLPPPPPPPAPKLTDLIEIVEDELSIDEELEIDDVEADVENKSNYNFDYDGDSWGEEESDGEADIFQVVEDMPQFPGGSVQKWIAKNVKYPMIAQENNIQGKVFVQFVIEKDGSVSDVKVARSVDPSLDKEAIRVVKAMPKWKPGKQRGKPVRVSYTVPINFQLQ